jgi:hypothetical protein
MPAGRSEPVYAPYTEHRPPDVTAGIYWTKNRMPDRWRDQQQHVLGKYIISDHPMSEEQWARERADVLDVPAEPSAAFGDGREENHLSAAKRLSDGSSPRLPDPGRADLSGQFLRGRSVRHWMLAVRRYRCESRRLLARTRLP